MQAKRTSLTLASLAAGLSDGFLFTVGDGGLGILLQEAHELVARELLGRQLEIVDGGLSDETVAERTLLLESVRRVGLFNAFSTNADLK